MANTYRKFNRKSYKIKHSSQCQMFSLKCFYPNVSIQIFLSNGPNCLYSNVALTLNIFVYCIIQYWSYQITKWKAKRRKMDKLRRDVARLYHFDQKDLERESLYSQEHSYYGSGNQTPPFMNEGEDIMPTTNL